MTTSITDDGSFFVRINPAGSFVETITSTPTRLELSQFGLFEGMSITIRRVGAVSIDAGANDNRVVSAIGLFVDSIGKPVGGIVDLISADPYAREFELAGVSGSGVIGLSIPSGAVALILRADVDVPNASDPNGDFGVWIELSTDSAQFSGSDIRLGTTNGDLLLGGLGNDMLLGLGLTSGNSATDTLDGGQGFDRAVILFRDRNDALSYSAASFLPGALSQTLADESGNADTLKSIEGLVLIGSRFNDSLTGSSGNDLLSGYLGNNRLEGGPGDDEFKFWESATNDSAYGGQGNDTFQIWEEGSRLIDGGSGRDIVRIEAAFAGFTKTDVSGAFGTGVRFSNPALQFDDTLVGVEHVLFWDQAVALDGSILGNLSNDTLNGTTGDDSLFGFSGNDKLIGSSGNDLLIGGLGNDILLGGGGDDTLDGGYQTRNYWSAKLSGSEGQADADQIDYRHLTQGISINLGAQTVSIVGAEAGTDYYTGIEDIRSSRGADTVSGAVWSPQLPSNDRATGISFAGFGGSDLINQAPMSLQPWTDDICRLLVVAITDCRNLERFFGSGQLPGG